MVGYLDACRPKLVDNDTEVMPLADALRPMIQQQDYSDICAAGTSVEKMRVLFTAVDSGGEKVKSAFYKSLMREEPALVLDILKEEPDRVINLLGEELGKNLSTYVGYIQYHWEKNIVLCCHSFQIQFNVSTNYCLYWLSS